MKVPNSKAVKILLNYNLLAPQETTADDFAYAKAAGLMFDPSRISHDAIVQWALDEFARCDRQSVATAFLLGLELNQPHLRAALSACAVMTHFPSHGYPAMVIRCIAPYVPLLRLQTSI